MADIGLIVLLLAFVSSVYSAVAYILGEEHGNQQLVSSARNAAFAACGLVSLASAILLYALFTHDFSLEYVVSYSSTDMSPLYILSAFWAGNAGSLLFWAWLISLLASVLLIRKRHQNSQLLSYTLSITMTVQAFFLIVLLFAASPFEKSEYTPQDGIGLNPVLEHPGMILHPPTLLGGYAFFTIPFAIAIAALLTNKLNNDWIKDARRWAILAWLLLGVGNIIGAWWAYVELGWGGYWAWDPVENAGLMPWLVGTAFLHSIVMQRKRGMLKIWSMALIILAFSLCIFGTFLTRSGVLSSVHSYDESHLGSYFLAFLGITLVGSFGLLLYRRRDFKSSSEITSLVSRESSFLLNNIILGVATIGIFIATMYPLLTEAVNGHKTTLQASFFDKTIAPVLLAAVFLAGICISLGWQRTSSKTMFRNYLLPLILALITSLVLFLTGLREWYALTLFPICAFVFSSHLFSWSREVRERCRLKKQNPLGAFWSLLWANKPRYAGMIVHLGMVLITIGVIGSSFYDVEKDATLAKGEAIELRGYWIVYDDLSYTTPSDTKMIVTARLPIFRGDKQVGVLKPKKEYSGGYYQQWTTEVGLRSTATEDLYVILSAWDEESGTATFKVLNNPLVIWIWIGGGFLLVGGVIAFWPDRRKGDLKESGRKGQVRR